MAAATKRELLRRAIRGCSAVVLAATPTEAEPVERALGGGRRYEAATKTLVVGRLPCSPRSSRSHSPLRVVLAVTGCDKTNVGHALTVVLEAMRPLPALVVQVGIAGALPSLESAPHPAIGDLVVADSETYADTGSSTPEGWISARELGLPLACVDGVELGGRFGFDADLVQAAVRLLRQASGQATAELAYPGPRIWSGPCLTSSRVTGTREEAEELARRFQALAESMEGAAAAHICALYRVPFLEIRGISNLVGDRDRSSWRVEQAAAVAAWAGVKVLSEFEELPLRAGDGSSDCSRGEQARSE